MKPGLRVAQAIRVDTSVIFLDSGNHELLCIHHRASQILHVSDLIEPHNCLDPGYQVSSDIAAIQDTMDHRRQQLSQPSSSGDGDSSDDDDDNRGSGGGPRDSHGNCEYGRM